MSRIRSSRMFLPYGWLTHAQRQSGRNWPSNPVKSLFESSPNCAYPEDGVQVALGSQPFPLPPPLPYQPQSEHIPSCPVLGVICLVPLCHHRADHHRACPTLLWLIPSGASASTSTYGKGASLSAYQQNIKATANLIAFSSGHPRSSRRIHYPSCRRLLL